MSRGSARARNSARSAAIPSGVAVDLPAGHNGEVAGATLPRARRRPVALLGVFPCNRVGREVVPALHDHVSSLSESTSRSRLPSSSSVSFSRRTRIRTRVRSAGQAAADGPRGRWTVRVRRPARNAKGTPRRRRRPGLCERGLSDASPADCRGVAHCGMPPLPDPVGDGMRGDRCARPARAAITPHRTPAPPGEPR
jgi:hypothetical protein